jgi:hypothetical protein
VHSGSVTPARSIAADGVIHVPPKGKQVEFWLGGAAPDSLRAYEKAVFNLLDRDGKVVGEVQQTHRSGLIGYGTSTVIAQEGLLLREKARDIPDNLTLKIGLHDSLGDDLPKIRQGLVNLPLVEIVPITMQQEVHYIIGRIANSTDNAAISTKVDQTGQLRVLNERLEPLTSPIGEPKDSPEVVVDLLRRRLKTLQAKQLLKTMMGDAATMKIGVDLLPSEMINPQTKEARPIGIPQTVMSQGAIAANPTMTSNSPQFPPKSLIQLRLKNQESEAIYMAVMVISRDGSLAVVYPYAIDTPIDEALVAPQSEKLLKYAFRTRSTTGVFELLVIASRRPLNKLLTTVKNIADARGEKRRGDPIALEADQSVEFATEMLAELDVISRGLRPDLPGRKIVNMNQLAVLSTIVAVR